ncbi:MULTISPECIES: fluoride efflux transporter CrcB [Amycolatopsis]|uniref:Fluoride-specific ion channel FluC n=2 Tax=Amycolatopsis TaxID=1813 RepID=A0A1I3KEF7_9PSEU|nr:fluoride efflux transporter CrcB [Amycolatopsis sacchari]SFI70872.1 CrcB protein [Amycolatopsis sacchari]
MTVLLVALGAAVGAPARYLLDRAVQARHGSRFPWGTLTVNVLGCFLLGLLTALPAPSLLASLLGTGFCGALTTYSTFSYETWKLVRSGSWLPAVSNMVVSLVAGLGAAYVGIVFAGAWLFR